MGTCWNGCQWRWKGLLLTPKSLEQTRFHVDLGFQLYWARAVKGRAELKSTRVTPLVTYSVRFAATQLSCLQGTGWVTPWCVCQVIWLSVWGSPEWGCSIGNTSGAGVHSWRGGRQRHAWLCWEAHLKLLLRVQSWHWNGRKGCDCHGCPFWSVYCPDPSCYLVWQG